MEGAGGAPWTRRIAEEFYRLRLRLLEASARYRSDGGREGVAEALSAVLDFLDAFDVEGETPDSDLASALQPLRALAIALIHPGPHPMFAPQKKPGRPERTHEWAALQALAAVAASHLIDADRGKRRRAPASRSACLAAGNRAKAKRRSHGKRLRSGEIRRARAIRLMTELRLCTANICLCLSWRAERRRKPGPMN